MPSTLTCRVEGGVAQVRLNRPDKLNALTLDTLEDLVATARELTSDRTLRGGVIAGEGDSVCAGLGFADQAHVRDEQRGEELGVGERLAGTDTQA